jgi:phosphoribosylanthranilate isomerase
MALLGIDVSPRRTRVKFCGMTRLEDARFAASLGVDAIGLVFYAKSPRAVSLAQAATISSGIPPFMTKLGLFVDADPGVVREAIDAAALDLLQFHGRESARDCEGYARPYIKALRIGAGVDIRKLIAAYASASGLLLDTLVPGLPGGTGQVFDWSLIPADLNRPIVLAGGLTAANVGEAIRAVHPYAVDVSGGIESGPGIKDKDRMTKFIRSVNDVDSCHAS